MNISTSSDVDTLSRLFHFDGKDYDGWLFLSSKGLDIYNAVCANYRLAEVPEEYLVIALHDHDAEELLLTVTAKATKTELEDAIKTAKRLYHSCPDCSCKVSLYATRGIKSKLVEMAETFQMQNWECITTFEDYRSRTFSKNHVILQGGRGSDIPALQDMLYKVKERNFIVVVGNISYPLTFKLLAGGSAKSIAAEELYSNLINWFGSETPITIAPYSQTEEVGEKEFGWHLNDIISLTKTGPLF
jgi:hypothetical protein